MPANKLSTLRFFHRGWSVSHAFGILLMFAMYVVCAWYNSDVALYNREYGPHGILSVFVFIAMGTFGAISFLQTTKILMHLRAGSLLAFFGKHTIFILCLHLLVFHLIDSLVLEGLQFDILTRSRYWAYTLSKVLLTLLICSGASILFSAALAKTRSIGASCPSA